MNNSYVSYTPETGIAYAEKYALNPNPLFYHAGVDCTNFISQCIWASYGGWNEQIEQTEIRSRISAGFRMVKGAYTSSWFGNQWGGSRAWENVDALWNFMTYRRERGPKAIGYNTGRNYTDIHPRDIKTGDVLQFSLDGKDYHHTVFVVRNERGRQPSYESIFVAQHTANAIRTLRAAIMNNGGDKCFMRRLVFQSVIF